MSRHLGSSVTAPPDFGRLARWIGISVAIHLVLLLVTSVGFIARGFKPAEAPKLASVAAPAAPPVEAAAAAKPEAKAADPAGAKPAAAAKPAGAKAKDAEKEYFKDDKPLSPDELKKGPSLDVE